MAAYEVLLLNTAIPQIQAAQSGDTYVVPRDIAINATAIISANSATDALRITQTGAGNAILVEDSANPDSTPFVVTGAGDVGIGTSSPDARLTVSQTTTAGDIITLKGANNVNGALGVHAFSNGGVYLQAAATRDLRLRIGSTDHVYLDPSGNLGLGVTPSAWGASFKALDMQARSAFASGAVTQPLVAYNAYNNGTNWIYKASVAASFTEQVAGEHRWFNAPSGTAGNAITFTQAMTLDASGNLGINNTSPSSFGKVVVQVAGTTTPTNATNVGPSSINLYAPTNGASTDCTTGIFGWNSVQPGIGSGIGFSRENAGDWGTQIRFYTHPTTTSNVGDLTERARITSGGDLLVGTQTNTNSSKVFVRTTATNPAFASQGATGDVNNPTALFGKFDNDTTTSQIFVRFTINNNGAGSGQITANGANTAAFGSYSDQRLKENIVDLPPQLANIMSLRPVEFDYIQSEGGGHQIGFIAQNMESVYPDVVGERPDGMKMLAGWSKTEARLVKAIQEQQAMINELKAKVASLGA